MYSSESKADTLSLLRERLSGSGFLIPEFLIINVKEWIESPTLIISQITAQFSGKFLAVRSSSKEEDGKEFSSAGKFNSELNIDADNELSLRKAINSVISSYCKKDRKLMIGQLIVQEMIHNPIMSGVLFTHELESGSPYYVINYDDITGSTSSVTSGIGEHSNRTLFIRRNGQSSLRSERFQRLISAVQEVEELLQSQFLDIEFAMNDSLDPILFQVRHLTGTNRWNIEAKEHFENLIIETRSKLSNAIDVNPLILGEANIFGQMPDWNPAEMIGRLPRSLAFSLYEKLITDEAWLKGRTSMGYHLPKESKLMMKFAGQPYIDVRLSFNSFLPNGIAPCIGEKLVNTWIAELRSKPYAHDKVEFQIVNTCFDFDLERKTKALLENVLDSNELLEFKNRLKTLTFPLLRGDTCASIESCMRKINKLEMRQKDPDFTNSSLDELIEECINLGTIPFSMLARHGFIAHSILESLKNQKVFNEADISNIHASTPTIASKLVKEISRISKSSKDKKAFLETFGHLRPGTYDILSPCYKDLSEKEFPKSIKPVSFSEKKSFTLSSKQESALNHLLKVEGCQNMTGKKLLTYIKKAISGREYAKFVFTRSVSSILENIAKWGANLGASREQLSHLRISDIQSIQDTKTASPLESISSIANENRRQWEFHRNIRLPQLLFDSKGIDIVPFQVTQPNFITRKKISAEIKVLTSGFSSEKLNGKIILIENADPGFDWIFSQEIFGLITKYGGANSHMAIRCAEFKIPAAIGCGELRYNSILKVNRVTLDCASRQIFFL